MIGAVALEGVVNMGYVSEDNESLSANPMTIAEAIVLAAEGDPEALKMLKQNVHSDYMERAFRTGLIIDAKIEKDGQGRLMQYGQTVDQVLVNSLAYLAHPVMQNRSQIEAHNGVRQQSYSDLGIFEDYVMVTTSLVADTMPKDEAKEEGFFTETMSCAIQLMTENEQGELRLESVFVAGAEAPDPENPNAEVLQFDLATVVDMWAALGVDYSGARSEEILRRPVLVHKSLIPNGGIDFAKRYDASAQKITGVQKFFGRPVEDGESTDYKAHVDPCKDLEEQAEQLVSGTVDTLIAESNHFKGVNGAVFAKRRLDDLNGAILKKQILVDSRIDANVLGLHVAGDVYEARVHYQQGNFDMFQHHMLAVREKGQSSSCPGKLKTLETDDDEGDIFGDMGGNGDKGTYSDSDELEDCEFISKECPKCKEKNVPTQCKSGVFIGKCGCRSDNNSSPKSKEVKNYERKQTATNNLAKLATMIAREEDIKSGEQNN